MIAKLKTNGFTVIELLVVLSVIGVLSTLGIAGFSKYNNIQVVQGGASDVTNTLNLAKSRALSQVKEGPDCGTSSTLIKYEVEIATPNIYKLKIHCDAGINEIYKKTLPKNVTFISPTTFSFPVLKGGVEASGQISLTGSGQTECITVNSVGIITQSPTCPVLPTPTPTLTPIPVPPTPTPVPPTPTTVTVPTPTPTLTPIPVPPTPTPTTVTAPTPTLAPPTPTTVPCAGVNSSCSSTPCCSPLTCTFDPYQGSICISIPTPVPPTPTRTTTPIPPPTSTPTPRPCVGRFGNCSSTPCCSPFNCTFDPYQGSICI